MFLRKTLSLALLMAVLTLPLSLFFPGNLAEAKTAPSKAKSSLNKSKSTQPKKKWAVINGFRSAKFGMDQKQVARAIRDDFKISSSKIKKSKNSLEKTLSLEVTVPEILATGGPALVGYVFGHQSKKLIQVNVVWGFGVHKNVNGQSVVDTANLLNAHFIKKKYKKDSQLTNAKLNKNTIIVFRGTDQKGRMALLTLNTFQKTKDQDPKDAGNKVQLKLSYMLNPEKPDVLTIKEGDF
jgi:hypothetical protein